MANLYLIGLQVELFLVCISGSSYRGFYVCSSYLLSGQFVVGVGHCICV